MGIAEMFKQSQKKCMKCGSYNWADEKYCARCFREIIEK
jgi:uncharacterized OB-fold protein